MCRHLLWRFLYLQISLWKMLWVVGFVVIFLLKLQHVQAVSVLLKNVNNCPNVRNPMPIPFDVTILKTLPNNTQVLDVTMDIPFPMDSNTVANAKIEYNTFGKTWVSIANFDDNKGLCNLFTQAGGEMWLEFQKAAGLTLRACPIPKGKYHTNHYILNLTKRKIPSAPPGKYRLNLEVREKSNKRILLCKMFTIEDKA